MFKLATPDQVYEHDVQVRQPRADGGFETVSFTAHYLYISSAAYQANLDLALAGEMDDAEFISRFLAGWEHIEQHDGTALAFSRKSLNMLAGIEYWARSVIEDYTAWRRGEPLKNSAPPRVDGDAQTAAETN